MLDLASDTADSVTTNTSDPSSAEWQSSLASADAASGKGRARPKKRLHAQVPAGGAASRDRTDHSSPAKSAKPLKQTRRTTQREQKQSAHKGAGATRERKHDGACMPPASTKELTETRNPLVRPKAFKRSAPHGLKPGSNAAPSAAPLPDQAAGQVLGRGAPLQHDALQPGVQLIIQL